MIIKTETSIANFEAWSGAVHTMEKLYNLHLCNKLETILDDLYPDGMDDTELNDILWFEEDWIAELLGYEVCPHCCKWYERGEVCECCEEEEED